jgi:putative transposase
MKAYKFRLYPTDAQIEKLDWTLARCCELYNAAVQERKDIWNVCKKHPNFYDATWREDHAKDYRVTYCDQANALPELKRDLRPEYAAIGSHVLQDVLRRVEKAFQGFFRRVACGQKPGYPRYHSYKRYDSFCFPDQSGWKLKEDRLSITGIGTIKVKKHREIQGIIKTTTIKREGKHWYVVFACDVLQEVRYHPSEEAVGIDLGLLHFATLSTAETIENPRYYRKAEKTLKKAQESLSSKKRGSNRRKKAVQRVARSHRKIRNQRKDFLNKESRKLVETYGVIVFEKLSTKNLVKRPKPKQDAETGQFLPNGASQKAGLNKSISDAGWGMFVEYCQHKAEEAGAKVLLVNPKDTSQICSGCRKKGKHKDLSERTHICANCGVVLDRDHNAALNILKRGKKRFGLD